MLSAVVRGPVAGAQDATVLRSPFSSTPQLCGNGVALRDAKGPVPSASDGRRRQCVSHPGLAGLACSGYGSTWASRSWSAASSCRCLKAETRRQCQCIWHSRRIAMSVPGSELLAESGQSWAAAFGQKQTLRPTWFRRRWLGVQGTLSAQPQLDPNLRSLHHVAGGHYHAIGEALQA